MEVILLERVDRLGQMGDVVTVKPGYARNFLLPRKKALRATRENIDSFAGQRKQLEAQNLERRTEAEQVAKTLDGKSAVVIRSAGESGQLYGSVTARNIADAITGGGVTIDRGQIVMERPIKTVGLHRMRVSLHPEVDVTVTINVARSEEEAGQQTKSGRAVTAGSEEEAEAAARAEEETAAEAAAMAAEAFLEQPPEPEEEPETESEEEPEAEADGESKPDDSESPSGDRESASGEAGADEEEKS